MLKAKTIQDPGAEKSVPVVPVAELSRQELNTRIELCKGTLRSNCIGTALYLVGERHLDEYVYGDVYRSYLSYMERSSSAVENCLFAWQRQLKDGIYVVHMGVVVSIDPLLMTHRVGAQGEFLENKPSKKVDLAPLGYELVFYLPKGISLPGSGDISEFCSSHPHQTTD